MLDQLVTRKQEYEMQLSRNRRIVITLAVCGLMPRLVNRHNTVVNSATNHRTFKMYIWFCAALVHCYVPHSEGFGRMFLLNICVTTKLEG